MSPYDLLTAATAVAAYGASAVIQIELRDGRRMTAVGAFGPALIALGGSGYRMAPVGWLIGAALIAELLALMATRKPLRVSVFHAAALLIAEGLFAGVDAQRWISGRPAVLFATTLSSLVYLAIEASTGAGRAEARVGRLHDRLVEAAPVHAVLVSTAGLTVLALPLLKWAAFPIVILPLLATAHEFGHFGQTRRTFDETVRALASLVEGAGYAAEGHHERVAELSVAIARECGLSSKQIRELELVALLHDVGAVSLSEPEVVAFTDTDLIAERSAQFVEETGYLAGQGSTVRDAARESPRTLEAAILQVANRYDELGEQADYSGGIESTLVRVDSRVARAFRAVIASKRDDRRASA
jgi:hypothetical protein